MTGTWIATVGMLLGGLCMQAAAQGIYACTDGKGRRLTSDRPIAECSDREQIELNPSGTFRRRIGPTLTAQERAVQEERDKKADEEKGRLAEERRLERALLTRYPNRAAHDKERESAIRIVDESIKLANRRIAEIGGQRKAIDTELEFYKNDPSKAPAALRRRSDEQEQSVNLQKRYIVAQENEKTRVNARFDEELARLKALWAR